MRPDGWHRAPEARGLPERWIVSAYRDGKRIHQEFSAPVREGLALTFRLSGEGSDDEAVDDLVDLTGDGLTIEPAVRWVYDFDEALDAGMAVKLRLDAEDLARGFSHLLVMGVRTSEAPETQADEIAALIAANNVTRGVAFVPQGSKTNNTTDNPSDYPPADTAGAVSFATYRGPSLAIAGRDGDRFTAALGLDRATADHLWGADRDEQSTAAAMGHVLWPATIGYFLGQMMSPHVDERMAEQLRRFMRAQVRGRGPFPAFRFGSVPYGLLPVSPLGDWSGKITGEELSDVLPPALQRLAGLWLQSSGNVPRVGRSGDPDADLIHTLAMDVSAQTVQIRRALGYDATWNIRGFLGLDRARFDEAQRRIARALLEALGEPQWDPRILHMDFADRAVDFAGPLIEDAPPSETDRLAFDYIAWLRTATIAALRRQEAPPTDRPVTALLYLMLRHGLLAEYDAAAKGLLAWRKLLLADEMREPELVGVLPAPRGAPPAQRSAWDRFGLKIAGVTDRLTLGEFLADPKRPASSQVQPVKEILDTLDAYRKSLRALEGLSTAELHRLFTETLDICSHRLDAWLTGLYAQRLEEMRKQRPKGLFVGCYGWVEDLRPDPPAPTAPVTGPDGKEAQARTDSGGYIYAPSMLHGAAAAVLRSAYLSRSGAAQEPYTIDLSSRRVRTAMWLIDTVREDQPLGAALGYQFERGLHEGHPGVELDKFIDELRRLYPLVANKAEDSGEPAESIAARNVVDGLRLSAAARANAIPFGSAGLTPDADERAAIDAELARLDDAVDAVGDLMTAEAVYQVLKGSTAGASATLDSLAKGTRTPVPEVASVPRSGTVLHQRFVVTLGDGSLPAEWAALPASPRATAAPELNAWLAGLFGPPDRIACVVTPDGGAPGDVTVADLALQPIDFFSLARAAETGKAAAEVDRRIAWQVAGAAGPDIAITIDYDAASADGAMTFAQAFEIASAAGRVLGFARPLEPRDLLPPELESRAADADPMTAELDGRATAARTELVSAISDLTTALSDIAAAPAGTDPDLAPLRAGLVRATRLGLDATFPTSRHGASAGQREALVALGKAALAALAGRSDTADAASDSAAQLQGVFGRAFSVIARFRPAATEILAPALANEPDLDGGSDATVEGWIAGLARVREPIAAWRRLILYQRAFARSQGRPRIVQLPLQTDPAIARWAALPFPTAAARPRSGLVSIAVDGAAVPQAEDAWSALLLEFLAGAPAECRGGCRHGLPLRRAGRASAASRAACRAAAGRQDLVVRAARAHALSYPRSHPDAGDGPG